MKKVFALAAAAFLVAGGSALAKTKTTSTDITLNIQGQSCTAHINVFNDPAHDVTQQVLVTAKENDSCQSFIGEGYVSKLTIAKGDTRSVAVIGGKTSLLPYPVTITLDYPFITGGQFTLSYTSDGVKITTLAVGTYTVAQ
jgi:hypothetical protein